MHYTDNKTSTYLQFMITHDKMLLYTHVHHAVVIKQCSHNQNI